MTEMLEAWRNVRFGAATERAVQAGKVCECGEPAEDRCRWKVRRYTSVSCKELERGDYICRELQMGPRVGLARITSIDWQDPLAVYREVPDDINRVKVAFITLSITYSKGIPPKVGSFYMNEGARIKALRLVECGAGVCSLHGRDPGEGGRVCDEHQNAWEKVA